MLRLATGVYIQVLQVWLYYQLFIDMDVTLTGHYNVQFYKCVKSSFDDYNC